MGHARPFFIPFEQPMSVKVLIVEGNAVARALLRRVVQESFSDIGDIVEAKNADEARAALQLTADLSAPAAAFQLILLDLELEDAQALQLLQRLARHPAKTVVTTLFADAEHLFPALQRGARGYLLKEDRFEVLVEELQKIVRGQPPLSPGVARQLQSYFLEGGAGQGILSTPERDVLGYLCKGFNIKEIANMTGMKWSHVNDQIKSIYSRLNLYAQPAPDPAAAQRQLI
jgi:DNA-binding NarL/FixJ family response regulator